MPASNDPLTSEMTAFFADRFGIAPLHLAGLTFRERGAEVWATSAEPPHALSLRRPAGLCAGERSEQGFRPSSPFLTALGDQITAARCELSREQLRRVALGQKIPIDGSNGPVAVCSHGDVFGAGQIRDGLLQLLLPTGHRNELLRALEGTFVPKSPDL